MAMAMAIILFEVADYMRNGSIATDAFGASVTPGPKMGRQTKAVARSHSPLGASLSFHTHHCGFAVL